MQIITGWVYDCKWYWFPNVFRWSKVCLNLWVP
jgi:hypothetical protein